jgi:hypothetical protein
MIMALLVLKLFVSSRPLKLEDVLCIYVLLLHEGQAEYHFAMFFYMLEAMIRLKRIYNFLSSMLVLHHLLHVLFTLRGIFM